jgi:uncharacterized protein involved in exopolysaccharide biosynthesis
MIKPMPTSSEESPFLLTFADLRLLVQRHKRRICLSGALGAFLALCYALSRPVEYEARATFKDKGKSQAGLSKSISELFFLSAEDSESDALMMLLSRSLYEALVQEAGIQLSIQKQELRFPLLPLEQIKNNLIAEYAAFKQPNRSLLAQSAAAFKAQQVSYSGEVALHLQLTMLSDTSYALYDLQGNKLGQGTWGVAFQTEKLSFILEPPMHPAPKAGDSYRLTFAPLSKTADHVSDKFEIEPDRLDRSFIKISYRHTDRYAAASHVAALMRLYQEHASKEHQRLTAQQVAYLRDRQLEMQKHLRQVMHEHAADLSSDLSLTGFANSEKALEFLASSQQTVKHKLIGIALEIERLQLLLQEQPLPSEKFALSINSSPAHELVSSLAKEIGLLLQEADAMRRLQGRMAAQDPLNEEFQGLNLKTARDLYLNYSQDLNTLESQAVQLQFILQQLQDPHFEISSLSSSLSTLLHDPISMEMVAKASNLALLMQDAENRSTKEMDRLQADLDKQRKLLSAHLTHTIALLTIREGLHKKSAQSLQQRILLLVQEQIAILEQRIRECCQHHLDTLKQEKQLLEKNLSDLKVQMAALPQKWTAERAVNQQIDLNRNMMEEIAKLVETKNISNNLEILQSGPIDSPVVPLHPRSPHLILLSLAGACLGMFLGFVWTLGASISCGVRASPENLRAAGLHVAGPLTCLPDCPTALLRDADLDTLRRLINFFSTPSPGCVSLLLLTNQTLNFCYITWNLAELLSKTGKRVLILDLDLVQGQTAGGGILDYLEGRTEMLPIEKREHYDLLPAGGASRFDTELLSSHRFAKALLHLQEKYDWILASSSCPLNSAAAEALLARFACAAALLNEETLDQLRIYFDYVKKTNNLSFLFCSHKK